MNINKGLMIVNDTMFNKVIRTLKKFFGVKDPVLVEKNRRASVIESHRIDRKVKGSISYADMIEIEAKLEDDELYMQQLSVEEVDLMNDYYDTRIRELEEILKDKKSKYFTAMNRAKIKQ